MYGSEAYNPEHPLMIEINSSDRGGFYYEKMVRIIELRDKYIDFFTVDLPFSQMKYRTQIAISKQLKQRVFENKLI
jgi:hypothetical protein